MARKNEPRDEKKDPSKNRRKNDAPSGYPGEMKALGESISGTQPEIGEKDTGVGRRSAPPAP